MQAFAVKPVEGIPQVAEVGGYVTVDYDAKRLGLTRGAISWALLNGKLRGIQLDGRTRLVKRSSLERYARRRERETGVRS